MTRSVRTMVRKHKKISLIAILFRHQVQKIAAWWKPAVFLTIPTFSFFMMFIFFYCKLSGFACQPTAVAVLHTLHILLTSLDVCSQRLPCGDGVD